MGHGPVSVGFQLEAEHYFFYIALFCIDAVCIPDKRDSKMCMFILYDTLRLSENLVIAVMCFNIEINTFHL